jgi:hypothetical protein
MEKTKVESHNMEESKDKEQEMEERDGKEHNQWKEQGMEGMLKEQDSKNNKVLNLLNREIKKALAFVEMRKDVLSEVDELEVTRIFETCAESLRLKLEDMEKCQVTEGE